MTLIGDADATSRPDPDRQAAQPDGTREGARLTTCRLLIAYDGTAFHGWQRQPGRRTVQGELEAALAVVLGTPVVVQGAGRTDAGVHAHGQVGSFRAALRVPPRALAAALRPALPADLQVREAEAAPEGFDARRSARARHYRYRLLDRPDVLWQRFAWWPRRTPAWEALAAAVAPLVGAHDCSAFRAAGGADVSPHCTIRHAAWERWEAGVCLDIVADRFLYHMVRNIVGTALAAAATPDPGAAMAGVLASRARTRAGVTAPPQGLCLEHVAYDALPPAEAAADARPIDPAEEDENA